MRRIHYLLTHAYCWVALFLAASGVHEAVLYHAAMFEIARAQAVAIITMSHHFQGMM